MEKMERGVNADLLREFHDKPVLWPNGRLSHSTKRYWAIFEPLLQSTTKGEKFNSLLFIFFFFWNQKGNLRSRADDHRQQLWCHQVVVQNSFGKMNVLFQRQDLQALFLVKTRIHFRIIQNNNSKKSVKKTHEFNGLDADARWLGGLVWLVLEGHPGHSFSNGLQANISLAHCIQEEKKKW